MIKYFQVNGDEDLIKSPLPKPPGPKLTELVGGVTEFTFIRLSEYGNEAQLVSYEDADLDMLPVNKKATDLWRRSALLLGRPISEVAKLELRGNIVLLTHGDVCKV